MLHHLYIVFGCNLGRKSVITCAHINTLLLIQRTLCLMHLLQSIVLPLQFTTLKASC